MRRAGTTFTRPRDWSASYQGRYASGGDHFYSTFLLGARARSPNKSNLAITLAYSDHWRMRRLPRAGTHIAVGRGNSRVLCLAGYKIWVSLEPRAMVGSP